MEFIVELKDRNGVMFWFGVANGVIAFLLILLSWIKPIEFAGANAWHKPIKFALSTAILSWSMSWYTGLLPWGREIEIFNWIIVITLAFEVIYIGWQASRGQASHYNLTTPSYAFLYTLMALAASAATIAVGYVGWKFFITPFPSLPAYYVWGIRLGMILFVIFSFEGFAMGSRLTHTVGGADGSSGLPFLNWSRSLGDLRVAHFVGMHALQILPLLAYYVLKDVKLTLAAAGVYFLLACYVLIQAWQAKPLIE